MVDFAYKQLEPAVPSDTYNSYNLFHAGLNPAYMRCIRIHFQIALIVSKRITQIIPSQYPGEPQLYPSPWNENNLLIG